MLCILTLALVPEIVVNPCKTKTVFLDWPENRLVENKGDRYYYTLSESESTYNEFGE